MYAIVIKAQIFKRYHDNHFYFQIFGSSSRVHHLFFENDNEYNNTHFGNHFLFET